MTENEFSTPKYNVRIILVGGLPGSGKSYFAKRLADQTQAKYISSDKIRKSMGVLGKYALEDKFAVYKEMVKITAQSLEEQHPVVVDATFYLQSMRKMFFLLADHYSVNIYFIFIDADEAVIRQRTERPRQDSEAGFSVYEKIRDELEAITVPHLILQSTNDNILHMMDKAMHYIDQNHAKE